MFRSNALIKVYCLLVTLPLFTLNCFAQLTKNITVENPAKTITVNHIEFSNKHIKNAIEKVDSIANDPVFASAFCQIYSRSMRNIVKQLQNSSPGTKAFIFKFEIAFAQYFLSALDYYNDKNLPPTSEWKCFFDNSKSKSWQIALLGVNTHVNIDIWQTLVNNFSESEIRHYKKPLLKTQLSIAKVYDSLFRSMKSENDYLKLINFLTLGYAKKFGERKLYKWRKRSVNLAISYYNNQQRFKRKFSSVTKKKRKIDQLILRHA